MGIGKKTNTDRKFSGGGSRPDHRKFRQEEAKERQEAYDKLSLKEKLALLDSRLGPGQGAERQRARLMAQLERKNASPPSEEVATSDQKPKLKAKERRVQEQHQQQDELNEQTT